MSKRKDRRLRGAALGTELSLLRKAVADRTDDVTALRNRERRLHEELRSARSGGARDLFDRICEQYKFPEHLCEEIVRSLAKHLGNERGKDIAAEIHRLEPVFAERERFSRAMLDVSMAAVHRDARFDIDPRNIRFEVSLPNVQARHALRLI